MVSITNNEFLNFGLGEVADKNIISADGDNTKI